MNFPTLIKLNRILLCLLVAGIVCVLLFSASGPGGISVMRGYGAEASVGGWLVSVDGVIQQNIKLPETFTLDNNVRLSHLLDCPEVVSRQADLLHYQTSYSKLLATIEGETVYTFDGTSPGSFLLPSSITDHYIPIRQQDCNKVLQITLTPIGARRSLWVAAGWLTTKEQALAQIIFNNIWSVSFDVVFIVLGIILVAAYFALLRFTRFPALFWLGLLLVCYVLWNSAFIDAFLKMVAPAEIYLLVSYCVLIILCVLWLFFGFYYNNMRRPAFFGGALTMLLVTGVAMLLLHVLGVADYSQTAWLVELGAAAAIVLSMALIARDFFAHHEIGRSTAFGMGGFMLFVLLDASNVVVKPNGSSILLDFGVLVFVLCYIVALSLNGIDALVLQSKTHALEIAAYEDQLTGLGNRRAFDRQLNALRKKHSENSAALNGLVVIMADSNNLKVINDTYGHARGDQMLVETAQALKQCFGCFGEVFRTGGDEFVVVCQNAERKLLNAALYAFESEHNCSSDNNVDVSWGVAYHEAEVDNSPESVLMRAEHRMYEYKKGCKL